MKVLFLNSTHYDYMQDILYSGLVKMLGIHNIKTLPFNKAYFLKAKKYPKNLGFTEGNTLKYLLSQIKKIRYDVVIIGAAKAKPFEIYTKIASSIPASVPVVFIDGGDVDTVGGDLKRLGCEELYTQARSIRDFDIVFKREMLLDRTYDKNVHPLPFGFNLDRVKDINLQEKKYDVSFWAVEGHPIRTEALKLIETKYDCAANGTKRNQSFKHYERKGTLYLEELKRCKVVLNFRGGGWDTLRYWEVPALATFLISQKPQIVIPNEFTNMKNIIYCKDDLSDLLELIDYYLAHDEKREQIAKKGFDHLIQFHTDKDRASTVINEISKLIR